MTIAVCTPELNGDVLWALPAARELSRRAGEKVDFWIGPRGRALVDLLAAQTFVRRVLIDESYEVAPPGCDHEIKEAKKSIHNYEHVHQLGFKQGMPCEEHLLEYFCKVVGLPNQPHEIDLPAAFLLRSLPAMPFVALAFKGTDQGMVKLWKETFCEFVRRCPHPVVEVGIPGTAIATEAGAIDRTSYGFLEMAGIISCCRWFVGTISAPLVIADAWPWVTRVAVHDGVQWDLTKCTQSPMNHYPVGFDPQSILQYIQ